MATRRSAEEKQRIIDRCVELEKEGGDVLAYLASENYVSPRTTWINIQRCDLEREPQQITDGLPHEVKQRRKPHQDGYRKVERVTAVQALIDGQNAGVDNYTTLKGLGYRNPGQAWRAICEWCQKHRPDLYVQLVNPTEPAIAPAEQNEMEDKIMTVEQAMEEITTAQNLAIVLDSMSQSEDGQTEVNLRKASTICVCYAEMLKKLEVKR